MDNKVTVLSSEEFQEEKKEKWIEENTLILSEPVEYEGEVHENLAFNFKKLKGKHLKNIARELSIKGIVPAVCETDKNYLALVAARAAGVPVELIDELSSKDFTQVTMKAMGFLLG